MYFVNGIRNEMICEFIYKYYIDFTNIANRWSNALKDKTEHRKIEIMVEVQYIITEHLQFVTKVNKHVEQVQTDLLSTIVKHLKLAKLAFKQVKHGNLHTFGVYILNFQNSLLMNSPTYDHLPTFVDDLYVEQMRLYSGVNDSIDPL